VLTISRIKDFRKYLLFFLSELQY